MLFRQIYKNQSIKINIAQNKKAGLERSQGATCGLPAQVRQKHLHCTEKPYPAGKSPVLKVLRRITVITCRLCSFKSWTRTSAQAEDFNNFLTEPANASWLNAQHGNRSCCCGCSGKEIYLSTAKIAPSLRNFLTPYVPVRNLAVVIVVIPRTTARVLFTKLGKLCVFYAVRTRRRAGLNLFIRT